MAVGAVTALMEKYPNPADMLRAALPDFELEFLEESPVEYRCTCSRERMERALISMGAAELRSLIDEQGGAELTCRFCDRVQTFTKAELEELLTSAKR